MVAARCVWNIIRNAIHCDRWWSSTPSLHISFKMLFLFLFLFCFLLSVWLCWWNRLYNVAPNFPCCTLDSFVCMFYFIRMFLFWFFCVNNFSVFYSFLVVVFAVAGAIVAVFLIDDFDMNWRVLRCALFHFAVKFGRSLCAGVFRFNELVVQIRLNASAHLRREWLHCTRDLRLKKIIESIVT